MATKKTTRRGNGGKDSPERRRETATEKIERVGFEAAQAESLRAALDWTKEGAGLYVGGQAGAPVAVFPPDLPPLTAFLFDQETGAYVGELNFGILRLRKGTPTPVSREDADRVQGLLYAVARAVEDGDRETLDRLPAVLAALRGDPPPGSRRALASYERAIGGIARAMRDPTEPPERAPMLRPFVVRLLIERLAEMDPRFADLKPPQFSAELARINAAPVDERAETIRATAADLAVSVGAFDSAKSDNHAKDARAFKARLRDAENADSSPR